MDTKNPLLLTAAQVLDREFLEMRAKVLELAASLDRLDRAPELATEHASDDPPVEVWSDGRLEKLQQALRCLLDGQDCRAERVQLIFSRAYEDQWRTSLGLEPA
jgi:hypothetical protein